MTILELDIDLVGTRGDGVARTENGPVFVPFVLKGEKISAEVHKSRGVLIDIIKPSDDRVPAQCKHFADKDNACGGCSVQHMNEKSYQEWKLEIVQQALLAGGIDHKIDRLMSCEVGERRRVALNVYRTNQGTQIGYYQAGSDKLVPISQCPVAHPKIMENLELFRTMAEVFTPHLKTSQMTILLCENGFDVAATGDFSLKDATIHAIAQKVTASKVVKRFSFNDEVLAETEAPSLTFGDTLINVPTGCFVQASKRAELEMASIVTKHLKSCKRVVDLFSGCGTFTFPLAQKSAVHAVETHGPALNAIDRGFRSRQGLKPISTERRDLFRSPLVREDLKPYQGVVFDPPRSGAESQSRQLARALNIKKVAAVSCNPISLARDLDLLIKGGFKIKSIVAIDQFLWSPHVETVVLLER